MYFDVYKFFERNNFQQLSELIELRSISTFVSIGGQRSSTQVIQTGVVQGSVLGLLLFLLYINDLNKSIKNLRAYHFADYTNILLSNESLELLSKKKKKK